MSLLSGTSSGAKPVRAVDLGRLLSPRAIAIVGASEDPTRIGGQPVHALTEYGYRGAVYPVHPHRPRIKGLQCYPDVVAIPGPCDVALIAVPAQAVPSVIEQCGRAGIPYAIVLGAGFVEAGNAELQERLDAAIKTSGVRVVGPNCVGVLNLKDYVFNGFGAGFRNPGLRRGPVAMVSQSGGFGYSVVAFAAHEGVGFNYMISTGNEADLTSLDFIEYFLESQDVELIVSYMEGVADGRRLRALGGRALELGKPIVVWKVGNSERGAKAALSHTANLTARYELYRAAFRDGGYVEIEEIYDLVDVAFAFHGKRLPRGNRVGVLTTSGGAGVLLADRCEQRGLDLPSLSPQTGAALHDLVPGYAVLENPVDLSASLAQNAASFNDATRILLHDPNVDMAIVRSFPGAAVEAWADGLGDIVDGAGKPVLVSLSGLAHSSAKAVAALALKAIPCFATPGRTVTAAASLTEFSGKLRREKRKSAQRLLPRRSLDLPDRALTMSERESRAVLAAYDIPVVRGVAVAADAIGALTELNVDFPVALKIDSRDIAHKTEAGGVRLGITGLSELKAIARDIIDAARRFAPAAPIEGVLVQEMASGVEMILGAVNDASFGPYVVAGMGGIFSEVIRDTALRFAPFGTDVAHEMIAEIKGSRVLRGYRGGRPYDLDALAQTISRLSWLIADHADRIQELDINPLFVKHEGGGVVAADGLIVLRDAR